MAVTLSTTVGPVTIKEAYQGYEAGIDIQKGPYINKVYIAPTWTSAFPSINALMGIGPRPIRHACPESTNLRCTSAVMVPEGEYDIRDNGRPQFNLPVIKATYAIPTWEEQVQDDPQAQMSFPNEEAPGQPYVFMEQSIDFDTEMIKVPGRAYKFIDNNQPIDEPMALPLGVCDFVIIRRWQTTLPYANFTAYLKAPLNSVPFLGQPMGLMRFRRGRTRRTATTDGTRTQEVELHFKWREVDHNAQHKPNARNFVKVWDGLNYPFGYSDLNGLLA